MKTVELKGGGRWQSRRESGELKGRHDEGKSHNAKRGSLPKGGGARRGDPESEWEMSWIEPGVFYGRRLEMSKESHIDLRSGKGTRRI